jgi:hypothetical protein
MLRKCCQQMTTVRFGRRPFRGFDADWRVMSVRPQLVILMPLMNLAEVAAVRARQVTMEREKFRRRRTPPQTVERTPRIACRCREDSLYVNDVNLTTVDRSRRR